VTAPSTTQSQLQRSFTTLSVKCAKKTRVWTTFTNEPDRRKSDRGNILVLVRRFSLELTVEVRFQGCKRANA
jgi:hypothetical protein